MAALEYRILTQLIMDGDLYPAIKAGLVTEEFKDLEAKEIWSYLKKHWFAPHTYHTLPTMASIKRRYPAFQKTATSDEAGAIRALIRDLKETYFESELRGLATLFQEVTEVADGEEMIASAHKMRSDINQLLRRQSVVEDIGLDEILSIGEEHYKEAKLGTIYGLSWPWPALTADTLGKNPGDFTVMYSRMKMMKTWVMLYCAAHDYVVNNARVFIWSKEMNFKKSALRLASILGKVDYQMFKKGKLPKPVLLRMKEEFDKLRAEKRETQRDSNGKAIKLLTGKNAPKNWSEVVALIQEFRPDIVYLDSFYHLKPDGIFKSRYERIAELAERVKEVGEEEEIPIIAVHQANRGGEKSHGKGMDDIADSDVIAREATLVMRIIKKKSKELHEDEYEKWWEENEDEDIDLDALFSGLSEKEKPAPSRPSRSINVPWNKSKKTKAAPKKETTVGKPKESSAARHVLPNYDAPRKGTQLGIIMSGNRDGTLEAIVIKAIPGYNFDFISSDYSIEEIESWLETSDRKKGPKNKSKGRGETEEPKVNTETLRKFAGKKPKKGQKEA
jgi:replicative DNA helicase